MPKVNKCIGHVVPAVVRERACEVRLGKTRPIFRTCTNITPVKLRGADYWICVAGETICLGA